MPVLAANINFDILRWAREQAALDEYKAARRAGISVNRLRTMESGEKPPTMTQLLRLADVYRRPTETFYASEPPHRGDYGVDFRRADRDVSKRDEALLEALLRDVFSRQRLVRDLVEDEEGGSYRLDFVNSAKGKSAKAVAKSIASVLGFDYKDARKRKGNAYGLYKHYRNKAEAAGVFVLCIGDLGTCQTKLGPDVFRGFVISDEVAPFVVINKSDSKVAWSYTLFHELAHIWLGETGVCGKPQMDGDDFKGRPSERFCNEVASEIMLPAEALPGSPVPKDVATAKEVVSQVAKKWSVSDQVVAYRMFSKGCFESKDTFEQIRSEYLEQRNKEKRKKKRKAVSNVERMRCSLLGDSLLGLVDRSLQGRELTHTKAGKLLGVNPARVSDFLRSIR